MGNGNGQYFTIFLSISIDESYHLPNCKTISIFIESYRAFLEPYFTFLPNIYLWDRECEVGSLKDLFAEYTQFLIYLRNT